MIYPFKGINDHEIVRDKDSYNNQIVFDAKNSRMNWLEHLTFTISKFSREIKFERIFKTKIASIDYSKLFNKGQVILYG